VRQRRALAATNSTAPAATAAAGDAKERSSSGAAPAAAGKAGQQGPSRRLRRFDSDLRYKFGALGDGFGQSTSITRMTSRNGRRRRNGNVASSPGTVFVTSAPFFDFLAAASDVNPRDDDQYAGLPAGYDNSIYV
jgi:hypothetical protein